MAISEGSWDGSPSRFSDEEYEKSCILDRKVCGDEWANKSAKSRCSLPIKEPNGDLNRAGVHAAAGRIGQVTGACDSATASARAKLRSAYRTLGETPPDHLKRSLEWDENLREEGETSVTKTSDQAELYQGARMRDHSLASWDDQDQWVLRTEGAPKGTLGILAGHFAVFDRWTEVNSSLEGHFFERMMPGAFTKTFSENRKGMKVLFNHGKDPQIGLKPLGTIRHLAQDSTGAEYEVDLFDTGYNRELLPALDAGQLGASFRFQVVREDVEKFPSKTRDNPRGIPQVSITEAKVREFGPVTFPQYADATASLRSLDDDLRGIDLLSEGIKSMFASPDPAYASRFVSMFVDGGVKQAVEAGAERAEEPAPAEKAAVEAPKGGERDAPTAEDYSITSGLRYLRGDLSMLIAKQLHDPDYGKDPDDEAVMTHLRAAEAAIDQAIQAQSKDSHPDPDTDQPSAEEAAYGRSEDDKTSEKARTSGVSKAEADASSAPAGGAPDDEEKVTIWKPRTRGATLTKRAAPLKTNPDKGDSHGSFKLLG